MLTLTAALGQEETIFFVAQKRSQALEHNRYCRPESPAAIRSHQQGSVMYIDDFIWLLDVLEEVTFKPDVVPDEVKGSSSVAHAIALSSQALPG